MEPMLTNATCRQLLNKLRLTSNSSKLTKKKTKKLRRKKVMPWVMKR